MLIAMAGLPGTGKSTLAARLAERLGGVVLNKDAVRAALFPPPALDYSREQDDLTLSAIYGAARLILANAIRPVIIDGRTFSRSYQVRDLLAAAAEMGEVPRIIECVCDDDVVQVRLLHDAAASTHPAKNRDFELYRRVKARAEPIAHPHLVLDTGRLALEQSLLQALEYLTEPS